MAVRHVIYHRKEQAAGSRAAGQRCLICSQVFWVPPLVWSYVAEGVPRRYAHIHHDGDLSPLEFSAPVPAEEAGR